MKHFLKNFIIFLAFALSCGASVSAAPVTVKAKLDSVQILMGKMTLLRLEVVQDKNARGGFPMFSENVPDGVIGVCGDSVELRTAFKRDTTEIGSGRIQINYEIPVQAFDSGMYRLPNFEYIVGRDTARSNAVTLKVVPVKVAADAQISGYADVADPAESSILDYLPDFVYYYWWLILLIIALIVGAIVLYRRFKKEGRILPQKPAPDPWKTAMNNLHTLKSKQLWENGMEREYFTELTDILRIYLDKRFGINAMEMTTRQILDKLSADPEIKDKKEYMRQVLDMADFVKFAAVKTLPSDNVASYENALHFLEETKPAEKEGEGDNDKEKGGSR